MKKISILLAGMMISMILFSQTEVSLYKNGVPDSMAATKQQPITG